ncbi:MAG: Hsp20/alpha crystallin family protein [Pseudomonadota bacterium]|nr:Hsp20/alpha crystallin family protein [Pseudomonadota bacterium]
MSDWFSGRRPGSMMPDFSTLQSEVNRVFSDLGFSPSGQGAAPGAGLTTAPRVDVISTEAGGYEIHAELPGVEESDIDLSVEGNMLTLSGERRQAREENRRSYRVRERSVGAFSRTIALPFEAKPEQIDAEFKNGVLTIRVERPREPERRGSKVNIRSGGGSASTTIEGTASSSSTDTGQSGGGAGEGA